MAINYSRLYRPGGADKYVKFREIGDGTEGVIVDAREHSYDDKPGDIFAQFDIREDDGRVRTWTVSQQNAIAEICVMQPQLGGRISARFTGFYATDGGKTGKHIAVTYTPPAERRIA